MSFALRCACAAVNSPLRIACVKEIREKETPVVRSLGWRSSSGGPPRD